MNEMLKVTELEVGLRAIVFSGRVDALRADRLNEMLSTLEMHMGDRLLVDLGAVELLDSMGLGLLGGLIRRTALAQAHIVICAATSPVRRTLEIAQFQRVVDILEDRESAVAWLASAEEAGA